MKNSIIFISTFILIVIIGALILCNNTFPLAKPIEIPKANEVYAVVITKDNITVKYTDDKKIVEIMNYFVSAKPTRIITVQDRPVISEYYTINIITKEDSTYTAFIYNENSKWYIEQPYYGVYETNEELLDFLP